MDELPPCALRACRPGRAGAARAPGSHDGRSSRRALDVLPRLADQPLAHCGPARPPPRRLGGRPGGVRIGRHVARRPRLGAQRLQRVGTVVGPGRRRLGALCRSGLPRERIPRARFRRSDLDLAGDAWNGDLATVEPGALAVRRGRSRRAARPRLRPRGRAPPSDKATWRDPGTRHTDAAGTSSSRIAAAARGGRRRTRCAPGEAPSACSHGGAAQRAAPAVVPRRTR